ncbi:DedA family protein [Oceanobacillus sp. 1P07AA]|uniref:DedA family protein n=1 Tax=Oceanobacillus sp. 1P07AA TaxID=3132293 RepID=UPI0039A4BF5F
MESSWITDIMEKFGYFGISFLIFIENIFPPIPSEIILTFGGFMTTYSSLSILGVTVASTIGSVLGAIVLYGIGRLVDIKKLERIISKWGHILRLQMDDIQRADLWFSKYGSWAVFFCRFVPLIRSLISLPAGMTHMNFGLFLLLTTLGSAIWNIVLVYIGAILGESWQSILTFLDIYSNIVYVLIILMIIVIIIWFIRKRIMKNN